MYNRKDSRICFKKHVLSWKHDAIDLNPETIFIQESESLFARKYSQNRDAGQTNL